MPFPEQTYKVQAYHPYPKPYGQPDWYTLRQTFTEPEARAYVDFYELYPDELTSGHLGRPTQLRALNVLTGSVFHFVELKPPMPALPALQQVVNELLNLQVDFHVPEGVPKLLKAAPQLLELCESLSSALDTVLLHHGQLMPPGDQQSRRALVTQAETLLKTLEPERL